MAKNRETETGATQGQPAEAQAPVRLGDRVRYNPTLDHAQYKQQLVGEVVCLNEDGSVNLHVRHPHGCGCFFRGDVQAATRPGQAGRYEVIG